MSEYPVVAVENLSHSYGERPSLRSVTFTMKEGEIFGLLGPNGSGKTTVFRILNTLLRPSSGTARVHGFDVRRSSRDVRRRIGVVFQSASLDRKLTALENLRHQGHLHGLSRSLLKNRIDELLQSVGLADRAREAVEHLSGGLQRRLELAKGLLHHPELLLLDEPSAGLDPVARRSFWEQLEEMRQQRPITIFLTTHLMEEAENCGRVGILDRGKLVALDTPNRLKDSVGGDVIDVTTGSPEELCSFVKDRFRGDPTVLNSLVRIERRRGHEFIAELVKAFPGSIDAVTVRKPTLEDVFVQRTGHRFWVGER